MNADSTHSNALTSLDQALWQLESEILPITDTEIIPVVSAVQRVLVDPVVATSDSPAWDNSAMDGYALCAANLTAAGGSLPLSGRIIAGVRTLHTLEPGTTLRIFTGAPLPDGADTVIPQESCQVDGVRIVFPSSIRQGSHIRYRGEEYQAGASLFAAGHCLRPQDIGLLMSQGIESVQVYRPLRVGIFSSGNELATSAGNPLLSGQIFDSNRPMLHAALQRCGFTVVDSGSIPDQLETTIDTLRDISTRCDLLISSGGVSVGEEDYIRQAIAQLGTVHLWRLAIQPGKPFAGGQVLGTPWLGLPGNPVAAMITFLMLARPLLWRRQGRIHYQIPPYPIAAGFDWPKISTRRLYLRCRIELCAGAYQLQALAQQSSAMLSSLTDSDGLAIIDAGQTVRKHDLLPFIPYSAFWS